MANGVHESRLDIHLGGDRLAMVYAAPSGARAGAILLHGGPGGQKDGPEGLYRTLAKSLGARGIASVRFDFRGVGESSGRYRT